MKVYVHSNLKTSGPYDVKDIAEHLQKEVFSYEDLFCYDNQNWVKFYELPGFKFSYESEQSSPNIRLSSLGEQDHSLKTEENSKKEITKLDEQIIQGVKKYFGGKTYTRLSRNIFVSFDSKLSFVLKISKFYESSEQYWFTLREKEFDLLKKGESSERRHFVFICPYHQKTFILNFDTFNQLSRNINNKDGNFHVFIYPKDEKFLIGQPSKSNTTDITSHAVELESPIDKCSSSEDSDQRAENTPQEQISNLENQTEYNPKSNELEKKSSPEYSDITNKNNELKSSKVVKLKFGALISKKIDSQ